MADLGHEPSLDPPSPYDGPDDSTRYRVVDEFPYLEREDEYGDLTLEEAAHRMDDLTGVGADVILSDVDSDGFGVLPWTWEDDETNRTVTLMLEVSDDDA